MNDTRLAKPKLRHLTGELGDPQRAAKVPRCRAAPVIICATPLTVSAVTSQVCTMPRPTALTGLAAE